ncbi:uncharacterized protein F4812DRAFT_282603 [Daldinia caldariorum]|uniref:uncharacterized protein n=1 Tax=Daldinia caldariorum TaxID=326644 RepID=UPI002007B770|nr:uncharacterized protein F4812DRAFT_282603 [Daldinia caldariorum]KAI1470908.1 hypothetical protein F4812DRAFT_282603 [Daldinia caldariorum]
MPSFTKTAASLAYLAAVAMATPIERRGEYPVTTISSFTAPSSTATSASSYSTATPITYPPPVNTCSPGTNGSAWQPTMYNIFPQDPDHSEPSVSFIRIATEENKAPIEQVIVFRGIPAGVKTCNLNWDQAAEAERNFTVTGSGLAGLQQLDGFPYGTPVSYSSVSPFVPENGKATHADFTFWDKQSKDAWAHSVGPVNCSEEIYIKLTLDPLSGYGRVYMDQDKKNGFHIDYTC